MNIFVLVIALILLGILLAIASPFLKKLLNSGSTNEKLPFQLKKFFFTRSEQEFFKILESQINHSRYTIFPKVRLGDFVETTATGDDRMGSWNKIRSKHIDFLIWDSQKSVIAVAIELDGNSHNSEKMRKSDDFKNKLYPTIGLKLVRVKVGSNFVTEISNILSELESDH